MPTGYAQHTCVVHTGADQTAAAVSGAVDALEAGGPGGRGAGCGRRVREYSPGCAPWARQVHCVARSTHAAAEAPNKFTMTHVLPQFLIGSVMSGSSALTPLHAAHRPLDRPQQAHSPPGDRACMRKQLAVHAAGARQGTAGIAIQRGVAELHGGLRSRCGR